MILGLEIALTIAAWLRGWKGWALLPLVIGVGLGFLLGLVMGVSGASAGDAFVIGLLFDLVCIVTLIVMVAKPRRKKSQQAMPSNLGSPVALPPIAPVVEEPLYRPVNVKPATRMAPATVIYPAAKAKLMLPDKSEISITEAIRPIGRGDFDRVISPEALKYISRQHLLIRSDNGRHFVEDYHSANGTKINGFEIKGKGKQELEDGDRIEVADVLALTFKTCKI